jgi:inhibitor of KinA
MSAAPSEAPAIEAAGDEALLIRFGRDISPETHARVMAALAAVDGARLPFVVDVVPAYASLLVAYDATAATEPEARAAVAAVIARAPPPVSAPAAERIVEIPVWYDPAVGPDLEPLAAEKGVAPAELVGWHTAVPYRVYALGFRPGFPFLGVVDPRLAAPRLPAPRARVAAGSVGVAGRQTGVYPSDGPGGWRILGRTPLRVFDPGREPPFLLRAGDRVRFVAVDETAFRALADGEGRAG